MEAIKNTVTNVMQGLLTKKTGAYDGDVQVLLKKVLTKKELAHIKFNYFRRGILSLYVDSSSWLYSLTLQKEDLLAKFSKKSNAIKDIRFCIGEIK